MRKEQTHRNWHVSSRNTSLEFRFLTWLAHVSHRDDWSSGYLNKVLYPPYHKVRWFCLFELSLAQGLCHRSPCGCWLQASHVGRNKTPAPGHCQGGQPCSSGADWRSIWLLPVTHRLCSQWALSLSQGTDLCCSPCAPSPAPRHVLLKGATWGDSFQCHSLLFLSLHKPL